MKAKDIKFDTPVGEITLKGHQKMVDDLPAWWQVKLEDLQAARLRREMGDAEFLVRLAAVFTHVTGNPRNQRIDPVNLDEMESATADHMSDMLTAGGEIWKFLTSGGDSGNATDKN